MLKWKVIDIHSQRNLLYCNDTEYLVRSTGTNSADPNQTAPKEQSDQGLHCLPFNPDRQQFQMLKEKRFNMLKLSNNYSNYLSCLDI